MFGGIDHLGIAVYDVDSHRSFLEGVMGLRFLERREYSRGGVQFRLDFYRGGETDLELVEVSDPESPIQKFLRERGEGPHHIAIRVEDIREAQARLEARGVRFAGPIRYGSRHALICFTQPETTNGLLIELVQPLEEDEKPPEWAEG
ncbi:MAG: VOC family protein [Nitrospinota bacterium]